MNTPSKHVQEIESDWFNCLLGLGRTVDGKVEVKHDDKGRAVWFRFFDIRFMAGTGNEYSFVAIPHSFIIEDDRNPDPKLNHAEIYILPCPTHVMESFPPDWHYNPAVRPVKANFYHVSAAAKACILHYEGYMKVAKQTPASRPAFEVISGKWT